MSHITALTSKQRRLAEKYLRQENGKYDENFVLIPRSMFPPNPNGFKEPNRVWRNNRFVVQEFFEADGIIRLSINRTVIDHKGRWLENISWKDLQHIKNAVGFGSFEAVEIFPTEANVVNVANMRHLWVMLEPLPFGWKNSKGEINGKPNNAQPSRGASRHRIDGRAAD